MAALTDSAYTVADYVYNMLVNAKATQGLADVWWGDQAKQPRTPTAAVEPGSKARVLAGAPRQTEVTLETFVMLYVAKITDYQENRKQSIQIAESLETLIHQDRTFGGLVIHNMVTAMDPGFATRGGALLAAVRLTITSTSKVLLPYA